MTGRKDRALSHTHHSVHTLSPLPYGAVKGGWEMHANLGTVSCSNKGDPNTEIEAGGC